MIKRLSKKTFINIVIVFKFLLVQSLYKAHRTSLVGEVVLNQRDSAGQ